MESGCERKGVGGKGVGGWVGVCGRVVHARGY
jgi:hypothetical protein